MEINGTLEYTKFHLTEKWELHYYADITIETHPKKKNNWMLRFAFDNEIAHTCVHLAVRNVRWTFVLKHECNIKGWERQVLSYSAEHICFEIFFKNRYMTSAHR